MSMFTRMTIYDWRFTTKRREIYQIDTFNTLQQSVARICSHILLCIYSHIWLRIYSHIWLHICSHILLHICSNIWLRICSHICLCLFTYFFMFYRLAVHLSLKYSNILHHWCDQQICQNFEINPKKCVNRDISDPEYWLFSISIHRIGIHIFIISFFILGLIT